MWVKWCNIRVRRSSFLSLVQESHKWYLTGAMDLKKKVVEWFRSIRNYTTVSEFSRCCSEHNCFKPHGLIKYCIMQRADIEQFIGCGPHNLTLTQLHCDSHRTDNFVTCVCVRMKKSARFKLTIKIYAYVIHRWACLHRKYIGNVSWSGECEVETQWEITPGRHNVYNAATEKDNKIIS
jgi:hypothetical protein